jgi:hypothetical protein
VEKEQSEQEKRKEEQDKVDSNKKKDEEQQDKIKKAKERVGLFFFFFLLLPFFCFLDFSFFFFLLLPFFYFLDFLVEMEKKRKTWHNCKRERQWKKNKVSKKKGICFFKTLNHRPFKRLISWPSEIWEYPLLRDIYSCKR